MKVIVLAGVMLVSISPAHADEPVWLRKHVADLTIRLRDRDAKVRLDAARSLGNLGAAGRTAVPALIEVVRDRSLDLAKQAAQSLAQIGALEELIKLAKDEDARVRARAIVAIGRFGPDGADAVPMLTNAVDDSNSEVRQASVDSLGEIGPHAASAAPALVRGLQVASATARNRLAMTLWKIGPAAVPPLVAMARNDMTADTLDALHALALLGNDAKKAVPVVRQRMSDPNAEIRAAAAAALGRAGLADKEVIDDLLQALADADQSVRSQAGQSLVFLAADGTPGLLKHVKAADKSGRWAPQLIHATFGSAPADDVVALIERLRFRDSNQRVQTLASLGQIATDSRAAAVALASALLDSDDKVRLSAALIQARIWRNNRETNAALMFARDVTSLAETQAPTARRPVYAMGGMG